MKNGSFRVKIVKPGALGPEYMANAWRRSRLQKSSGRCLLATRF